MNRSPFLANKCERDHTKTRFLYVPAAAGFDHSPAGIDRWLTAMGKPMTVTIFNGKNLRDTVIGPASLRIRLPIPPFRPCRGNGDGLELLRLGVVVLSHERHHLVDAAVEFLERRRR